MVNGKAFFAWLFPLKIDCKRSQAVFHTYLKILRIMMYNFEKYS